MNQIKIQYKYYILNKIQTIIDLDKVLWTNYENRAYYRLQIYFLSIILMTRWMSRLWPVQNLKKLILTTGLIQYRNCFSGEYNAKIFLFLISWNWEQFLRKSWYFSFRVLWISPAQLLWSVWKVETCHERIITGKFIIAVYFFTNI